MVTCPGCRSSEVPDYAAAVSPSGVPAVSLMGRSLSQEQIGLLHSAGVRHLTVLLDGDEAGRSAAAAMMEQLAVQPFRVKFALLPDGTQPDTVEWPVLQQLLSLPD